MHVNDLFQKQHIDPATVLVLRHHPRERELNNVLPLLAVKRPELFNAYQQVHGAKLEKAIPRVSYIASFIGHEHGKAIFIGLYSIGQATPLTKEAFWQVPANKELKEFGMRGFTAQDERPTVQWFDLSLTEFYADWKGKLIVKWPSPEVSWWRWAHRNTFPIHAILEESALDAAIPAWDEMEFSWKQLSILPPRWQTVLSEWRGIYYIYDTTDGKGYVGAAYGENNILGRWLQYAATGHGDNRLLRKRDPQHFRFTILQRVSPDLNEKEVVKIETTAIAMAAGERK